MQSHDSESFLGKVAAAVQKAAISVLLISVCAVAQSQPASTCADSPPGLVSCWSGESSADDEVGGKVATLVGNTTYAPGKFGNAFSFDGYKDWVRTPNVIDRWPAGTIELWVNFRVVGSWSGHQNQIFASGHPTTSVDSILLWGTGWGPAQPYGFTFNFCVPSNPCGYKSVYSYVKPVAGQWYHVVGTWGADGMKLYVDGVLTGTNPYSGAAPPTSYHLIGASYWDQIYTGPWSTDGLIDEVKIYSRALTADQVRANYCRGSAFCNEAPVAEAGSNQSIHVGLTVYLNGSGSHDDHTPSESLAYAWSFNSRPEGSGASLNGDNTATPSFVPDLPGNYFVSLVVTDEGGLSSAADEVTVSSLNTPPTAAAGPDQGGYVGGTVFLDGAGSSDPDSDPITYAWLLKDKPDGSSAVLNHPGSVAPWFRPDVPGAYVARLVVHDGYRYSDPDEIEIAVITADDFAQGQSVLALNTVSALPLSSVTTEGNQTALGNLLLQAVKTLQKNDGAGAIKKLRDALERTDGCALRGGPDAGGGGGGNPPAKDYIARCADQATIYPVLVQALTALAP